MKIIDIHAHAVFKKTLNSLKNYGPEIGGNIYKPWFRVGKFKFEGARYDN